MDGGGEEDLVNLAWHACGVVRGMVEAVKETRFPLRSLCSEEWGGAGMVGVTVLVVVVVCVG